MSQDFHQRISLNRRKSFFLLLAFFVLVGVLASLIASWVIGLSYTSLVVALVFTVGAIFITYQMSTRIALGLNHAKEVSYEQAPKLHNLVEEISIAAGINKPKIYIVDDPALNAFATGKNVKDGHVAFTTGILNALDREQLQGVVAHEISHIKNEDVKLMTIAAATASVIVVLAELGLRMSFFGGNREGNSGPALIITLVATLLAAILAPLAAMLIQASISRSRESLADASAVEMTRNPVGMRRALEALQEGGTTMSRSHDGTAHMWIGNPLKTKKGGVTKKMNSLFATHPPLEDRIEALRQMGG